MRPVKARAERLIDLLPQAEVDVLLVNELVNVRYVTGFSGSNGLALVGPRSRTFVTDFRYVEQAAEEVDPSFERRRAPQDLIEAIVEALELGQLRLGFEAAHVSVREHQRLRDLLPDRVELVPTTTLVEGLRSVKEPEEIERIRAAAQLADEAFEAVVADGLIGRTEREAALSLEWHVRNRGAERPSFEPIIAAGPHGALPHARPRDVEIRRGDLVVIDWGAQLDGYCSDCTRTVGAGQPSDEAAEVYEIVLRAQRAGVAAVRAGASGRDVDGVAREAIGAAGYGEHFGHGLGHGVGLDIHEAPRLSTRSEDVLASGNVVTVEPGIYLPGRFGIRIEDLVVVGDDGCEILNGIKKELLITG
jgi:Xaa-Pro aminopeptidase